MDGKTTIQVRRSTKRRLEDLGNKTDTFEDIITKLLDFYDEHQ